MDAANDIKRRFTQLRLQKMPTILAYYEAKIFRRPAS